MQDNEKKPALRFKGFTDPWEQRKLGEIAVFSKGVGYSKNDLCEEGTPIILYGRLYTKYETCVFDVDTFVKEKAGSVYSKGGEVIVPASGETAEDISIASVVVKPGILLGGDLNIVSPTAEYDSAFLALTISSGATHKYLSSLAQGKSVVHLHNSDIQSVSAKFPTKREQEKIHLIFGKIDTLITLHQRKYEKLVNIKKSMLDKMFPKNGASVPEIRFKGFTDLWEQRKLGELVEIGDIDHRMPETVADGIPYLMTGDFVGTNELNFDGTKMISEEDYCQLSQKIKPEKGDILFARYASVGAARYVDFTRKFLISYSCAIIKKSKKINSKYLYHFITSGKVQQQIKLEINTGSQANIGIDSMKNHIVVSMPPLEEQTKIADALSNLDHLITLHQRKLEKLQNIKKSCLEKMFV